MAAPPLRQLRLHTHDGLSLAADELPGSAPCHVFLHGLGSGRVGDKSASLLAWARHRRLHFLRYDFRGHGESEGDIRELTLGRLVADGEVALGHVGRAVLVGSSLGGLVAAWVAARQPERTAGLVLIAPAFGFLERMTERPHADGRIRIENEWVSLEIDAHVLEEARAWPEHELPTRLTMPTLIVHGEGDDVVPAEASERLFAAIPHTRKDLWLVPGGDHRLTAQIERIWPLAERLFGRS